MIRLEKDAVVLSFSQPVRTLSWAVLNGGFCYADHVVNHHVNKEDTAFAANPRKWLSDQVARLRLKGKVVAMATAVEMEFLAQASFSHSEKDVTCFATVGLRNALTVGDETSSTFDGEAPSHHTVNMVVLVQPGLRDEAMVEAVQIATEGRVRAFYEAGILSCRSGLSATGTGTDCIAIVSLVQREVPYCGKHTRLGELIGLAVYTAVRKGLANGLGH